MVVELALVARATAPAPQALLRPPRCGGRPAPEATPPGLEVRSLRELCKALLC